jgi:protein involved in polysaccharide export with SLBB domain
MGYASTADCVDTAAGATLRKTDCPPGAILTANQTNQGMHFIQPSNELQVDFYPNSEFNRDLIVRPDGEISLDVVGAMPAVGLTPEQ